ncbi:MAG: hypothetical protein K2W97_05425 [Chthoniobacterales bacterium]|nr:hypothetical protein [Chthoniobacterales bacterium]
MKPKNNRAIVAVVSSDCFHQAVVLWRSIKRFEGKSDFIIFVIGYDKNDPDYQNAGFTVVDATVLNPKEWHQFIFQYNAQQAACALKPLAILKALKSYEKVIYLDTDIKLFGPLKTAWEALESADLSLTPHYYQPIPYDSCAEDFRLLVRLSGIFNAGYVGATQAGGDFLKWLWEQTKHNCIESIWHGLFLDQRWLDSAVALVRRLHVVQDRTYNVAYWNLHERELHKEMGRYFVNEELLTFFHFAGLTKESDFSPQKEEPPFYELFRDHQKELACAKKKLLVKEYPFRHFKDGEVIDESWKEWMRRGVPELENIQNPFLLKRSEREQIEAAMVKRPLHFRPKLEREI